MIVSNDSEADYLADQEDWLLDDVDYLEAISYERLVRQKNKYIIVGSAYNRPIYLQDKRISHDYWTKYKANARVFNTRAEAEKVNAHFKYNNTKVVKA